MSHETTYAAIGAYAQIVVRQCQRNGARTLQLDGDELGETIELAAFGDHDAQARLVRHILHGVGDGSQPALDGLSKAEMMARLAATSKGPGDMLTLASVLIMRATVARFAEDPIARLLEGEVLALLNRAAETGDEAAADALQRAVDLVPCEVLAACRESIAETATMVRH